MGTNDTLENLLAMRMPGDQPPGTDLTLGNFVRLPGGRKVSGPSIK
jgi:hypothetical protein